jgi:hypothetical protein
LSWSFKKGTYVSFKFDGLHAAGIVVKSPDYDVRTIRITKVLPGRRKNGWNERGFLPYNELGYWNVSIERIVLEGVTSNGQYEFDF